MSNNIFDKIADYLIKTTREESILSGFQYVVDFVDIEKRFGIEIQEYIQNKVIETIETREEVAEVFCDTDGYDVTLYTNYVPNYIKE